MYDLLCPVDVRICRVISYECFGLFWQQPKTGSACRLLPAPAVRRPGHLQIVAEIHSLTIRTRNGADFAGVSPGDAAVVGSHRGRSVIKFDIDGPGHRSLTGGCTAGPVVFLGHVHVDDAGLRAGRGPAGDEFGNLDVGGRGAEGIVVGQ